MEEGEGPMECGAEVEVTVDKVRDTDVDEDELVGVSRPRPPFSNQNVDLLGDDSALWPEKLTDAGNAQLSEKGSELIRTDFPKNKNSRLTNSHYYIMKNGEKHQNVYCQSHAVCFCCWLFGEFQELLLRAPWLYFGAKGMYD